MPPTFKKILFNFYSNSYSLLVDKVILYTTNSVTKHIQLGLVNNTQRV